MLGESGGEKLLLLSLTATPKKSVGAEEEEAGGGNRLSPLDFFSSPFRSVFPLHLKLMTSENGAAARPDCRRAERTSAASRPSGFRRSGSAVSSQLHERAPWKEKADSSSLRERCGVSAAERVCSFVS